MQVKALHTWGICLVILIVNACSVKRAAKQDNYARDKEQIAQFRKGDLTYEVYRQYLADTGISNAGKNKQEAIRLSIRIINKAGNISPLRAISGNYDEYNSGNEYLLNAAKNDIMLLVKDQCIYPLYYSFENNYNAFPFETINVGYRLTKKQRHSKTRLVFVDKVFTRDSIFFNLNFK